MEILQIMVEPVVLSVSPLVLVVQLLQVPVVPVVVLHGRWVLVALHQAPVHPVPVVDSPSQVVPQE